jgi:hypothetical protein
MPDYFAPAPPSTVSFPRIANPNAKETPDFRFKFDLDEAAAAHVDREILRVMRALNKGLDEAATALVIAHLRDKGYTILEPGNPDATLTKAEFDSMAAGCNPHACGSSDGCLTACEGPTQARGSGEYAAPATPHAHLMNGGPQ